MEKRPTITAIIPARAGSKGIPGKNLWAYNGISLLARAIRIGKHCAQVDRVIVSTDSPAMRMIALDEGAECPALRPTDLASDAATSAAVVDHVITSSGVRSEHLLLLQVTSPLRRLSDCNAFLAFHLKSGAPATASIVKHDEPRPEKLKRLEAGLLKPYMGEGFEGPRQSLPQPYALNGAFYAIASSVFMKHKRFLPDGAMGFEMPTERSHNLDSPLDMQILETMLAAGHWQLEDLPQKP
jgi:CMP-N,N'-diacetyllegionaminic acid synthase